MKRKVIVIQLVMVLATVLGLLPVTMTSANPVLPVLFQNNFESGASNWALVKGTWALVSDGTGNHVYEQQASEAEYDWQVDNCFVATNIGNPAWKHYRLEARMKVLEPSAYPPGENRGYGLGYRVGTGTSPSVQPIGWPQGYNQYQVQIKGASLDWGHTEISVYKGYYAGDWTPTWDELAGRDMTWFTLNTWLTMTVEVRMNHHKVSVTDGNNTTAFEFDDNTTGSLSNLGPLTAGGIGLNACGRAQFDDVQVTDLTPRLVFTSYRDSNEEIYWMYASGTSQTRLTENLVKDTGPALSPDGTKVAFTSWRDGNQEIYVMNADGTGVTRLTNNSHWDCWPTWSPDGTRIAFMSTRDGNGQIYAMNANGSNQARLTNNPLHSSMPTWSHDGSQIAFQRNL